ncbi:MAG TPA: pyridoxamine 5'-phosphate oxidase family protein [Euzebyales bacterium]|nr:pyridoxamine 5'-phosphate oxidase family protein [Euzebyales bacterium]
MGERAIGTLVGSCGEHMLQERYGTTERARSFYDRQVLDHLNPAMREFVTRQEMVFVATSDGAGECDCSFRAGPAGFVHVIDERSLAYPEYRGNGVMASLGNVTDNAHVGLLFVDFFDDIIGLHVNGGAEVIENDEVLVRSDLPASMREAGVARGGRRPERWVWVTVEEAYIHCSKHIPWLQKRDKAIYWGTDDARKKGGDYFGAARGRAG